MSSDRKRVVIVGASLAGTSLALSLVRQGIRATVIDKEVFPRRKACGEGLSCRGFEALRPLGLGSVLDQTPTATLNGYAINGRRRRYEITEPAGVVGIKRFVLDTLLIDALKSAPDAEVYEGETIRNVEPSDRGFTVTTSTRVLETECLVAADGSRSTVLNRLGYKELIGKSPRLGLSSAWGIVSGASPSMVETFLLDGGEIFVTAVGGESLNVSFLGTKRFIARYIRDDEHRACVSRVLERIGIEAELVAPVVGAGPLNTHCRGGAWRGAFVVGDAAETFDPIAGMGMSHALQSGILAASHIVKGLQLDRLPESLTAYASCRERMARTFRGFTRLTGALLTTSCGRALLPALNSTGIGSRFARAVHSSERGSAWRSVLQICGA